MFKIDYLKKFFVVSLQKLNVLLQWYISCVNRYIYLRWATWVVLGFVWILLVVWLSYWVIEAAIHHKKEVLVPKLVGKTVEQALDIVAPFNLSIAKEGVEFDETLPAGAVLRQKPVSGLRVREGRVVRIVLSSGGEVVFVPEVIGRSVVESESLLRQMGLALGAVTEAYSYQYEKGWVMNQVPTPHGILEKGNMVDLIISKGPPPEGTCLMPDFLNQSITKALAWAKAEGFQAEVVEELDTQALPSTVIEQNPSPESLVSGSVDIRFVVSRSSVPVEGARIVSYKVPSGGERMQVRIVIQDEEGEREVFQGYQKPDSTVELPVVLHGHARARIFVNDVLVEVRPID